MTGKTLFLLAVVGGGAAVASQWPDIRRYIQIRQLSQGDGHPQNVPAHGRTAYPQPSAAAPDAVSN